MKLDFSDKRILVVGDICLDRNRIAEPIEGSSREVDIPIHRVAKGKEGQTDTYSPGGGGNVAYNLASLGSQVCVLGITGPTKGENEDYHGYILRKELENRGIDTQFLIESPERTTITFEKTYSLGKSEPSSRWDNENNCHIEGTELEERLLDTIQRNYGMFDAIVATDYCEVGNESTAAITPKVIAQLGGLKNNIKTYGASRNRIGLFNNFYCLVPNDNEIIRATKRMMPVDSFQQEMPMTETIEAGREFHKTLKPDKLIVTVGEKGALYFPNGEPLTVSTKPLKEDIDICGCGDTFLSTLVLADLSGITDINSIDLANKAAGTTAKKLGTTGAPTINDLL
jgi:rfaE bifunctional protein kinase chain/domain